MAQPSSPEPIDRAREIAEDSILQQILWLVKNGIPFDVANCLDMDELLAYSVIFGQFEGGTFNWKLRQWVKTT